MILISSLQKKIINMTMNKPYSNINHLTIAHVYHTWPAAFSSQTSLTRATGSTWAGWCTHAMVTVYTALPWRQWRSPADPGLWCMSHLAGRKWSAGENMRPEFLYEFVGIVMSCSFSSGPWIVCVSAKKQQQKEIKNCRNK